MAFRSVPRRFQDQARAQPGNVAYAVRRAGRWDTTDWATAVHEVTRGAAALIGLGLRPGDRVAIMGANSPSWTLVDLATMTAGGIPVGIYANCSAPQASYIARHAGARFVFVDGGDTFRKFDEGRALLPELRDIVFLRDSSDAPPRSALAWDAFLEAGDGVTDEAVMERLEALRPEEVGTLIYTSGTTGPPKGSMLTHGNMAVASDLGRELLPGSLMGARHLSYLPLAHAAERALTVLGPASFGYGVWYAESIEEMASNLREVRPDIFLGVPRVWEKIRDGVGTRLAAARGPSRALVAWARRVALAVNESRCRGREPRGGLAWEYRLARRLVFDRLRRAIGLDRARVLISGAAPLDESVLRDLASFDLNVREVYGQTENCGPATNNRPGETRWGSVGRPFVGCDVRIAKDGEILVRGGHVFAGYFRDEDATGQVLRDGWLHSGDLGYFDGEGFLFITGRKKEIIITAGGKNVAPRNLEEAIKRCPLVDEAIVIGDRRRYLTALVAVRAAAHEVATGGSAGTGPAATPAAREGTAEPESARRTREEIWLHVEEVNRDLAPAERIKRIAVLPRPLSVGAGELTPTLKVRRSVVLERYADLVEALYAPGETSPIIHALDPARP